MQKGYLTYFDNNEIKIPEVQKNKSKKGIHLFGILSGLYISTSQFYVGESGSLQPAHFIIILMSFLVFFTGKTGILIKNIPKNVSYYAGFILYSSLVNIFWTIKSQDTEFIINSFYYLFDFSILMIFIYIFKYYSKNNIVKSIDAALFLSLAMFMMGLGRHDFPPRYNGYFNDPNQMGLWILCLASTRMLLKENNLPSIRTDLSVIVSLILSFATQSRSTIIGLLFIFSAYLIQRLVSSTRLAKAIIMPLVIFFVAFASNQKNSIVNYISNIGASQRFGEISVSDDLNERGWYRIIEYPDYLIFGAGQGQHFRFDSDVEIHSTWAGIIFYYGLIGFTLFFVPFLLMIKNLKIENKIIILAPLAYSISTFSARTPIFWVFIAAAIVAVAHQSAAQQKSPARLSPYLKFRTPTKK
jgi:hypothetical protein